MEYRCPKCKIDLKNEDFKSIKERYISVLFAEKRRKEIEGTYRDIEENENCDLCGTVRSEIFIQVKLDILDKLE